MPTKNRIATHGALLLLLVLAVMPAAAQSDPQPSPTVQSESSQPIAGQPATPERSSPKFAVAKSGETRFEAGVQFSTFIRGRNAFFDDGSSVGGGGRLTFNLIKFLDLEGEFNYFPSNGFYNARKIQAQFGAKTGVRFNKFGVFGKLRPGFVNLDYNYFAISDSSRTTFSMDLGGVVEFYPSKRMIVRFDIGDTILAEGDQYAIFYSGNPSFPASYLVAPGRASHNLQISAGVGFRF